MNKYKLLFDFLKLKTGSDATRIIIYKVLCDDQKIIKSRQEKICRTPCLYNDKLGRLIRHCLYSLYYKQNPIYILDMG